jgi:hypothetical protein
MLSITQISSCPLTRSLKSLCTKSEARPLLQRLWPDHQPRMLSHLQHPIYLDYLRSDKIVVKPNISSGSKGVSICSKDCLTQDILNLASTQSLDGQLVIEEYIPNDGNKYFCEGLKCDSNLYLAFGLSTSLNNDLLWDGSTLFTHVNCTRICGMEYNLLLSKLTRIIGRLIEHLGLQNLSYLPFNIDFFIHDADLYVIEFAPRPGGNFLHLYLEYLYDINYAETFISSFLHNTPLPAYGSPYLKPSRIPISIQIHTQPTPFIAPEQLFRYPLSTMPATESCLIVSHV